MNKKEYKFNVSEKNGEIVKKAIKGRLNKEKKENIYNNLLDAIVNILHENKENGFIFQGFNRCDLSLVSNWLFGQKSYNKTDTEIINSYNNLIMYILINKCNIDIGRGVNNCNGFTLLSR